jgi:hypothetical protein
MRKILISLIVLLAASLASSGAPPDRLPSLVPPAQAGGIMLMQGGVPVAAPAWALGANATVWENCEDATLQSGFTTGGTVTFGDSNSEWNSASDGGVYGATMPLDGVANYIQYQIDDDSVSWGAWFKTPDWGNNDSNFGVIYVWSTGSFDAGEYNLYLRLDCDGCGMSPSLMLRGASGTTTVAALAANTWYFITMQAVRNGTSSVRLYDSSKTVIGASNITRTAYDYNDDYHGFGIKYTKAGKYVRWDDIVFYSDSTFPLQP